MAEFCEYILIQFVIGACMVVILANLAGCNSYSTQPSCLDNPRNMRCMSAEQLEKELRK